MTCKDCVHYDVCLLGACINGTTGTCLNFKDKSCFIELPCKAGDTVYALYNGKVLKANIFSMKIETEDDKYVYMLKLKIFDHFFQFKIFLLGKTVFLTPEEAEKALERSKGNETNI